MTLLLIKALGMIFMTWVLLFTAFVGWGMMAHQCMGLSLKDRDFFRFFWIGWGVNVFFLLVWHLFFKIDAAALLVFLTIGCVGVFIHRDLFRIVGWSPGSTFYCLALLFFGVLIGAAAILPPLNYDTGLYHLQAVRWNEFFPAVPGLGNLHHRLAYNSSEFLYASMIDMAPGPWRFQGAHFANSLLLIVLTGQLLRYLFKPMAGMSLWAGRIFAGFLLLILIPEIVGHSKNISSLTPDFPFFVIQILISCALIRLFDHCLSSKKYEAAQEMAFIVILAAVGMTVRPNILVFDLMALLTAAGIILFFEHKILREEYWVILAGLGMGSALFIVYLVNNLIVSGYFIFPIPNLSMPLDWTMPHGSALSSLNSNRCWAISPELGCSALPHWAWLRPWLIRALKGQAGLFYTLVPLTVFFLNTVIIFSLLRLKKISVKMMFPLVFLMPSLIFMIYWFFSAPDPRFLGSAGCLLAAGTISFVAEHCKKTLRWAMIAFLILGLIVVVLKKNFFMASWEKYRAGHSTAWQGMVDQQTGLYFLPQTEVKKVDISSELSVYTPQEGDQCWDAPLPCTPYLDEHLRLRVSGDFRQGFKVVK